MILYHLLLGMSKLFILIVRCMYMNCDENTETYVAIFAVLFSVLMGMEIHHRIMQGMANEDEDCLHHVI